MANVTSYVQVKAVVAALLRANKIANATHNIMAYRIHVPDKQAFLQVGGRRAGNVSGQGAGRAKARRDCRNVWEPVKGMNLNSG